jgi:trehalose 6-phosphate synthase/phosphatase
MYARSREMRKNTRLLVVSNRLPVAFLQEGAKWSTKRTEGGLATAMTPIMKRTGGVWLGWSGTKGDIPAEALQQLRQDEACIAVDLSAELIRKFYDGHANEVLWPLLHSFPLKLHFNPENWEAYIEANRRYCAAVRNEFRPGDRIWVHDYHLMLLPGMLREVLPDVAIGFFLHTPFPASDIFAMLPRGEELLVGMAGADLLGFQTHHDLQHFRTSMKRLAGIDTAIDRIEISGRNVRLRALPIGIAPHEFAEISGDSETEDHLQRLRAEYDGKKMILAVDRLDYTKGIQQRLRTFRRLLHSEPSLIGKVVMLEIAVPSRENVDAYQSLRSEINELISEINGDFGKPEWSPIVYVHRGLSKQELVAAYRLADVAWVSPLRDGMNLVAKEYIACHPEGDGVLVLSSFAGAAAEMTEALLVNPLDEERTAWTVARALGMPDREKRRRTNALYERVIRNDVFAWGDQFLESLEEAASTRHENGVGIPPPLPVEDVMDAYRQASTRLLLLDYDGTLVPITEHPEQALPGDDLRTILAELAQDTVNSVFVISGRRVSDLQDWLGAIPRLGLVAEHGACWRMPGAETWNERSHTDSSWKESVRPILEHFTNRVPGTFVEEKRFSLVWHYRAIRSDTGDWLAKELGAVLDGLLTETDVRTYQGHKIVEVKPVWANKGAFAADVLDAHPGAFVLAAGDDLTDEDMFGRLPASAYGVHVGNGPSRASYSIADPKLFQEFFNQLVARVK